MPTTSSASIQFKRPVFAQLRPHYNVKFIWMCPAAAAFSAILCPAAECQILVEDFDSAGAMFRRCAPNIPLAFEKYRTPYFLHYTETISMGTNSTFDFETDPLTRAQYLLEIYGNPISETDSLDDPELLMDVMEAREELEEASTEEEVEKVKESNNERIRETMEGLAGAFGATPPDLTRAKTLAIELQYLKNLERAAREWQPGKRVEVIH
ncbi:hypothetical protein QFC19_006236 [Naganishia cerealis]|uniref:Uncharacterized protein n=1 Tax=Naganishia cerealis TaxID=610337 RepID=A0ACC2VK16_9TREE|nr:hypothetical protein QFC19_006236 [Naganishia cerealis]